MIDDPDFRKFIEYCQITDPKNIDMEDFMRTTVRVFEKLKEQIAQANPEQKRELITAIREMYQALLTTTKLLAERSGLTEEQLLSLSEENKGFSKQQWSEIQSAKEKLRTYAQQINHLLQPTPPSATPKRKSPKGPRLKG